MTHGKTLDGSYDIEADTLIVNESTDLRGNTLVEGPALFNQNLDLQNLETTSKITISASEIIVDYNLNLPPTGGEAGQLLSTDGLGNSSWATIGGTGGVSYIAVSPPNNFMTVNGLGSDSTFTSKTFNLELSGILPVAYGGTGLSTVGTVGQVLVSNGSGLNWSTRLSSISVTSPLVSSGAINPTLSLSTVPTTKGGTGLTTVGANGTLLSSNGSGLFWATPSTYFGVERVTARAPLGITSSSTSTRREVYIEDFSGTDAVVLQNDSLLNNTIMYNASINRVNFFHPDTTNPFEFRPRKNNNAFIDNLKSARGTFDIFGSELGLSPVYGENSNDFLIRNYGFSGPYNSVTNSGPFNSAISSDGSITLTTGLICFDDSTTEQFNPDIILFDAKGFSNIYKAVKLSDYTDGHPLKNISPGNFSNIDGDLVFITQYPKTFIPAFAFLRILGSQYEGGYFVEDSSISGNPCLRFLDSNFGGRGLPDAPITIRRDDGVREFGVGLPAFSTGDINILSSGWTRIFGQSHLDLVSQGAISISAVKEIFLKSKDDITINSFDGKISLLGGTKEMTLFANNFTIKTPVFSSGGGIDSYIAGTIAWNATSQFRTTSALGASIADLRRVKLWGGQNIELEVDNAGVELVENVIDFAIIPILPGQGNITLECNGKFFIPVPGLSTLASIIAGTLLTLPVGDITLRASGTGAVKIYGGNSGVFIESRNYAHSFFGFPTGNAGISLQANEGPLYINSENIVCKPRTSFSIIGVVDSTTLGEFTCNTPGLFTDTLSIKASRTYDTAGAGKNGALLHVIGSDWVNAYSGGCSFWSGSHFGSVRLLGSTLTEGPIIYDVASTVFIDSPTDGDSRTEITNLYALYVNGKTLQTGLIDFQNKAIFSSNFVDILVIGGNAPTQPTSFTLRNGDEQTLAFGIAGGTGQFSEDATQGDAVIRADEDHDLFLQTGIGKPAMKISTDNNVVVRKSLVVSGDSSTESPALTVGRPSNDTTKTCLLILNEYDQDLTLGVAGADGDYSTTAFKGDAVIKSYPSRALLLQSGNGVSKFKIDSTNKVFITSPTLTTPKLGVATGESLEIKSNIDASTFIKIINENNTTSASSLFKLQNDNSNFKIILNSGSNPDFGGPNSVNLINDAGDILIQNASGTSITLGILSVKISVLGASCAVQTDSFNNLVSITNTGSGSNVLASSPTLITPVLGAASGTSLLLSSLTASYSVHTDASKNLVSIQNSGTGLNILQTSPTLITPVLGAASGTSLLLSALTASYSVHTDASKNLVSIQNSGTGLNILQTSPTITTPTINASAYTVGGVSLDVGFLALSSSTLYNIIGAGTSNDNDYGRIFFNYVGANNSLNSINFGTYSGYLKITGGGAWNLVANSYTLGCTMQGAVTHYGSFTLSSAAGAVNFSTPSATITGLTASYSVHTDASKNLVSIQNSGTGLNILQTTPTLITPILGAATGTSLQLSALTASYSVHTDASKNLVSIQNSGTGLNILQTSPTLITPILGAASGTSLLLSALTASYSVHTDASKNLVSIQNSGTGLNILQTSPTLITPILGAATGTSLQLSSLTGSSLVMADSLKNLVSLASGTNTQILTLVSGTPTWAAPATSGTVTSVALSVPSILSITGSPITSSGTLAITTTVAPNGTGAIVLTTSPTLITPILGAASGTSLLLSALTASYSVHTDASKNLVSIQNSGTGLNILQTSPTITTPTINASAYTVGGVSLDVGFLALSSSTLYNIIGAGTSNDNDYGRIFFNYVGANNSLNSINFGTYSGYLKITGGGAWNLVANSYTLGCTMQGAVTHYGSFTLSSAAGAVNFSTPSATITGLTASYSVHTDASKNLVSIQNSGTGLNILQTTPTLITPILGAATGTSLQLSALTASYSVHTDASKNLVSIQNSGTGLNILQTSPTLITPILGAASGTSLLLSALTASYSVHTDASKNLVSIQNSGTGLNILQTSPALITPTISGSTSSFTGGTLAITNSNTAARCCLSVLAASASSGSNPFIVIGKSSTSYLSGVIQCTLNSLTPTATSNVLALSLYSGSQFTIDGNGNTVSPGTSSATSFITTSDYRLKKDIRPIKNAISQIKKLKPCTYSWIKNDFETDGFIAHELQEVLPYAVDGEKDSKDKMQGVDYSKLTPLLVAAVQELILLLK